MRGIFYHSCVLVCMGVLLLSCEKGDDGHAGISGSGNQVTDTAVRTADITLNFTGAAVSRTARTVLAATPGQSAINDIQVFIFKGDTLDGYVLAEPSASDTMVKVHAKGTAGVRDIWAFCNAPDLSGYTKKSELLSAASSLYDNDCPGLVMGGCLTEQNVGIKFESDIHVRRYASCLRIDRIVRSMDTGVLRQVNFRVRRVYLTNVVEDATYSFGYGSEWINPSFGTFREMDVQNTMLCDTLGGGIMLEDGHAVQDTVTLYAYPNVHASDDKSDNAAYKRTRMVVECQMDLNGNSVFDANEYFTYPLIVGALKPNTMYDIRELVIRRPGNSSNGDDVNDDGEDEEILPVAVTFTVSVNDWTDVLMGRIEI